MYVPFAQRLDGRPLKLIVKSRSDPARLAASVRAAVSRVDPNLPLYDIQTFDQIRESHVRDKRFVMAMMSAFASLAFALAGLGLYGVISYVVQLRTREIGVRMALGASAETVRRDVMIRGAKHATAGIIFGLAATLGLSHLLGSAVQTLGQLDVVTMAYVSAAMLAITLLSTWLPARTATRIDPAVALKYE